MNAHLHGTKTPKYCVTQEGRAALTDALLSAFHHSREMVGINNFFNTKPVDTCLGACLVTISIDPNHMQDMFAVFVDAFYARKMTPAVTIGFASLHQLSNKLHRCGQEVQLIFTLEAEQKYSATILRALEELATMLDRANIACNPESPLTVDPDVIASTSLVMQPLLMGVSGQSFRYHYRCVNNALGMVDIFAASVADQFLSSYALTAL